MSVTKYFGTDGIRGRVSIFPITPSFFFKFGVIIGRLLFKNSFKRVIVGTDTRISSYMLELALNSGLSASGVLVMSVGIISTPAIGYLTRSLNLEVGIVISASHNLFWDNGIKLFVKGGKKASSILEKRIEKELDKPMFHKYTTHFSEIKKISFAHKKYINFCKSTLPSNFSLRNFKIVLDCANGSTYKIAPKIFRDFGANLIVTATSPNGYNINKNCGVVDIEHLKRLVLSKKADIGLAFDGDGDRIIMIDHFGNTVNGDHILYILAKFYLYRKNKQEGVVGTVMSNNGLLIALKKLGIPFIKTKVGDKNIIKKLKEKNWTLGAESSGHVIMMNKSSICDGVITSLQIIKVMIATHSSLFQLYSGIKLFPQEIVNINFSNKNSIYKYKKIQYTFLKYKNMLGKFGKILLRKSGTESCFRVIVEHKNSNVVTFISNKFKNL
ncbi:MAG: phosphoglucosamine mutase [Buchnera aphidicola (Schlechtendalia peitan)]